jgi:hypothetical protein
MYVNRYKAATYSHSLQSLAKTASALHILLVRTARTILAVFGSHTVSELHSTYSATLQGNNLEGYDTAYATPAVGAVLLPVGDNGGCKKHACT